MRLVRCDYQKHGARMLEIVNDTILNTTWLYDYQPRTGEQFSSDIQQRLADGFPVIVAEDDSGALLGFGTYGEFRRLSGYRYTVEHSVFVDRNVRRQGVGRTLLLHLLEIARESNVHVLIGAIDASNKPSVVLHESLGFELCGTLREAGYKHGSWLDVLLYQLVLETPRTPTQA